MFNIGLILGISAIIYPLSIKRQLLKFDVPVMVFTTVLFLVLFYNGILSRIESLIFVIFFVLYMSVLFISSMRDKEKNKQNKKGSIKIYKHWTIDIVLLLVGLVGLVYGSNLLVENAVIIAKSLGMSEAMIGLTIVAAGTSMPELATSVVAAIKKRSEIAIGNIVGSNIYNVLLILGVSGLIYPIETPDINIFDSLYIVGISVLLWLFMKMGTRLKRWQGIVFLVLYIIYFMFKLGAL